MTSSRRDFAARLLLEGLVIVVSILAAFALDRWSDGRRAAAEERQVLEGLCAEFVQVREDLERYRGHQLRILHSIRNAADALVAARATGAASVVLPDTAIGWAFVAPTVQPSLGTLEGLLASARLGVLRYPELRRSLAGWGGAFEDLAEEEEAASAYMVNQVDPVLRARVDVWPFRGVNLGFFDSTMTPETAAGTSRIPVDDEIIAVLAGRIGFLEHGIEEYEDVLANVDRILERVEASLDGT